MSIAYCCVKQVLVVCTTLLRGYVLSYARVLRRLELHVKMCHVLRRFSFSFLVYLMLKALIIERHSSSNFNENKKHDQS